MARPLSLGTNEENIEKKKKQQKTYPTQLYKSANNKCLKILEFLLSLYARLHAAAPPSSIPSSLNVHLTVTGRPIAVGILLNFDRGWVAHHCAGVHELFFSLQKLELYAK